jgi:lysophospholipase L1-like esterase
MKTKLLAACLASCFVHGISGGARAATLVAAVGDSITQGSGWPDRLGTKLGAAYTVKNYGLSGTTLLKQGDHPYWTSTQYTQSHTSNPDIVVIMLGTNDSKPFNWNAHKGEFAGDYQALIDTYAALPSKPRIYLVLCPPAGKNGFQIVGTVIENEIVPLIKQVANEKGLPTIDVFTAFGGHDFDPTLFGSAGDQVHPGGAGAQRIADTVYAALVASVDGGAADAAKDAAREAGGADVASEKPAPVDATGGAGTGGAGTGGTTGAAGTTGGAGSGSPPPVDSGVGTGSDAREAGTDAAVPPSDEAAACGCVTAPATGGLDGVGGVSAAALLVALLLVRRHRR